MRLRQVAWVARDLASSTDQVKADLGLEVCFSDPGVGVFGLENALFPVGDQFLEIVSPVQDGTTAGRLLDKRGTEQAPCDGAGYMVIFQTTETLDDVRARAAAADIRIVFEADGGSDADGTAIHGIHFHPADVGGAIVSIDRSDNAPEWAWAGPSWRRHVQTSVVDAITGVTMEVAEPDVVARRWAELLGVEAQGSTVRVDDAVLTFCPPDTGPARGVVGLRFSGPDERRFELIGTDVRVTTA